jgi:hypothetical protein
MSFTGAGPLGSFAWGTTTIQALQSQHKEINHKYDATSAAINNKENRDFPPQPFPELASKSKSGTNILNLTSEHGVPVWPAAVFTANEVENWPADKRVYIAQRKKEFSDQPQDIIDATTTFREAALHSLQKRHAAIGNLQKVAGDSPNISFFFF